MWSGGQVVLAVEDKVGRVILGALWRIGGDEVCLRGGDAIEGVDRGYAAKFCPLEYSVDRN